MYTFVFLLLSILAIGHVRLNLINSLVSFSVSVLIFNYILGNSFLLAILLISLVAGLSYPLLATTIRRNTLTKPLFIMAKKILPKISDTEQTAISAGNSWWDRELFNGKPNWQKLLSTPKSELTPEEQKFIDEKVTALCDLVSNWEITKKNDLPKSVWEYLSKNKFFGLIIPKKYGGLEFSAYAHSRILQKVGTQSAVLASTIAVPNSLGPAELLLHYGTQEQQEYYLPRLATGDEIPCFALTGIESGSDATNMSDHGYVCYEEIDGKKTLGIRVSWNKRYITLAPKATVLGLAFILHDPDHLISEKQDIGITCALIPTDTKGVMIGNRHIPLNAPFHNGPTSGKDVFITIDQVIGGKDQIGNGWKMLVECLSCGRAISLPSIATGGSNFAAISSGLYSMIRHQFGVPIAKFEGIAEKLAELALNAYISSSVCKTTMAAIDHGEKPSVISAICKYHLTENARSSATAAMDIHGGKGIILGPKNYLAHFYINAPIGITVEGANILTRCLIIYGQGSIRAHNYVKAEYDAASNDDLKAFDQALWQHIGSTLQNVASTIINGLSFGYLNCFNEPKTIKRSCQKVSHASSAFTVISDLYLLLFGGKLKFKEMLSAKLGDLLSDLYLASCVIKEYYHSKDHDSLLANSAVDQLMHNFWNNFHDLLSELPVPLLGSILKIIFTPFGKPVTKPSTSTYTKLAEILTTDNQIRDQLVDSIHLSQKADQEELKELNNMLPELTKSYAIEKQIYKMAKEQQISGNTLSELITDAKKNNFLTIDELKLVEKVQSLRMKLINVDDFTKL